MISQDLIAPLGSTVGPTILIVEDDALVRAMLASDLRAEQYTVLESASADEALQILQSAIRVDIVVTDMQMPGSIDGSELVRQARSQWPYLKLVMVSGQVPDPSLRPLLDGYMQKPFLSSELIDYLGLRTGEKR